MNPPRLTVRGVHHAFARREVLAGIDLAVDGGQVVALVGPSGCGKTTLLHLCAGMLRPSEGLIENGFANPACMFQQPRLLPWKTALDNVALGLAAHGEARARREMRARELALRLGLVHADLAKFPHELSGGMQSRVALARALAIEPDLLLLDEPFSALDIGLREELYALLVDHLAAGSMGVLMITHDLMEAVRLSDRILVMASDPGRIAARFELKRPACGRDSDWVHAATAELLRRPIVRTCFGLPAPAQASPRGLASPQPAIVEAADPHGCALPFARNANRC